MLLHQLVNIADAVEAKPSELMPSPNSLAEPTMRKDVARVVENCDIAGRSRNRVLRSVVAHDPLYDVRI